MASYRIHIKGKAQNQTYADDFRCTIIAKDLASAFAKAQQQAKTLEIIEEENDGTRLFWVYEVNEGV